MSSEWSLRFLCHSENGAVARTSARAWQDKMTVNKMFMELIIEVEPCNAICLKIIVTLCNPYGWKVLVISC